MNRDHAALSRQLDEVESYGVAGTLARRAPTSAWDVGQHLDHVLKVAAYFLDGILVSPEKPPRRAVSLLGRIVLVTGFIPRGKGKAPERVVGEPVAPEDLRLSVRRTRAAMEDAVQRLAELPDRPRVRHPYFGGLTPSQALAFARIHTHHHLKIVREILRESPPARS